MKKLPIAAQLYTVRKKLKEPGSTAVVFEKIKKIGYAGVELFGGEGLEAKDLKSILDRYDLKVCGYHVDYEKIRNNLPKLIADSKILGNKHLIICWIEPEYRTQEGYLQLTRMIRETGEKLAKENLSLCYHNHSFELARLNDKTALQYIIDECPHEFLKMEIDTHWIQRGGGDPAQWIERLKGRIPLVHLKDIVVLDDKGCGSPFFAEVGEGNMNWQRIFEASEKAGAEWYVVEQDECQRDPLESLRLSYENLRKMGIA